MISIKDFIDYYELLGVSPRASEELIKKAYRISSKNVHPDMGGKEFDFIQLKEAYDVLIDQNKRKNYDELYKQNEALKYNKRQSNENTSQNKEERNTTQATFEESINKRQLIFKYLATGIFIIIIIAKLINNFETEENTTTRGLVSDSSDLTSEETEMNELDSLIESEESLITKNDSMEIVGNTQSLPTSNSNSSLYRDYVTRLNNLDYIQSVNTKVWEYGTDFEINEFAESDYKLWDDMLNEIYLLLKGQLTEEKFRELRDSQRMWLVSRDEIAESAKQDFLGGSWENAIYKSTLAEETKKRCYWLIENY